MYLRVFCFGYINLAMLDTNIGDDGAKAIAVALQTNTTLTSINLWGAELIWVLFVDLL
jgi:hypothetical protein